MCKQPRGNVTKLRGKINKPHALFKTHRGQHRKNTLRVLKAWRANLTANIDKPHLPGGGLEWHVKKTPSTIVVDFWYSCGIVVVWLWYVKKTLKYCGRFVV